MFVSLYFIVAFRMMLRRYGIGTIIQEQTVTDNERKNLTVTGQEFKLK